MAIRTFFTLLLLAVIAAPSGADTLDDVRARDSLRCGVNGNAPGLSLKDAQGRWTGLDADFCRAVAAAVLRDPDKVTFVSLDNTARLEALAKGRIDLLARNTTWTLSRDTRRGMSFVGTLYYDGQGLMVPVAKGLHSALELDGARVCVARGTTSVGNLQRYFLRNRMKLEIVPAMDTRAALRAYLKGRCDALSSDASQLYGLRAGLPDPGAQMVLPERLSKEPLAPAVRKGDTRWFDIVRWTLFVLLDAEELGIGSRNATQARRLARSPESRRLLGLATQTAHPRGLDSDWAFRVISRVGNYAEMFERNLTAPLGIKRGLNALWRDGGLQFAPPMM